MNWNKLWNFLCGIEASNIYRSNLKRSCKLEVGMNNERSLNFVIKLLHQ